MGTKITDITTGRLSDVVQNYEYAGDRLNEISTLIHNIKNPVKTKLIFQTLPRHMRRRTMTHNVKRLPRKFRAGHTSQMKKSGLPQKTKRPSRKFRRKPSNLMKEYLRRQQSNIWLETHIWHAKRFHMVNRHGYKLPLAPCDKSFRACYRATIAHCLLQDVSYLGCIEISGPLEELNTGFKRITNSQCGLGITAKAWLNGNREGKTEVFHRDSFPYSSIGKISFIWKPADDDDYNQRTIWIFAHAAFYKELMEELIELFDMQSMCQSEGSNDEMEILDEQSISAKRNSLKEYSLNRTRKYHNSSLNISATELKDTINRFRLTGPLAHAILSKALNPKKPSDIKWQEIHNVQTNYWNSIKGVSPSELPPHVIVSLNIEDARLNRPKQRTKAVSEISRQFNSSIVSIPKYVNCSRIWSAMYRTDLITTMMTTHELNQKRSKSCLVPGETCDFEADLQEIPIMLIQLPGIQNPKFKRLSYGSGWDIIIPGSYGFSVWLNLIMWGARAGGLREAQSISRESGCEEFLPDTLAGIEESNRRYMELRKTYFRKPPNKRINYNKLSIASPFKCPWKQLLDEWELDDENMNKNNYFVLRNLEQLKRIQDYLLDKKVETNRINFVSNCLIPVNIMLETSGSIHDFAIICIPTLTDLRRNKKHKRQYIRDFIHTEPLKKDECQASRKELRKKHLQLLKRMRNRRVRDKRKKQETSEFRVRISRSMTETLIKEHYTKLCEMWLSEVPKKIRHQCSREVMGYITQGDFSFTESKSCGVGYVTAAGLNKLMSLSTNQQILIRNPGTRVYRLANIKIPIF